MKTIPTLLLFPLACVALGNCGMDTDGDGVEDIADQCPIDPNKTEPGNCGCNVAEGTCSNETDTDGDGTNDQDDKCPADPNKILPGKCGCGISDKDTDGDNTADCNDNCPQDPNKFQPGLCGCGVSDKDTDGDNTADCKDNCPQDPNKVQPGECGCGIAEGNCSTEPIITASADNAESGEGKEMAFDGDVNTKWLAFFDSAWIQVEFGGGKSKVIKAYRLTSANDYPERDPRDWKLLGSNDGSDWTTLDERSNDCFQERFLRKEYRINNDKAYKMIRLDISTNKYPSSANSTQLAEIELLESSHDGIGPGVEGDCNQGDGTDFTIGVIGDTQNLSESDNGKNLMIAMNQFLVDRKEELNVVFVISVGDMTQDRNDDREWSRVKEAYDVYKPAGIPFAPCQGNHDGIASINKWFPVQDFENTPTWGGSMNGGIENAYYLISAGGMDFVLVVSEEPYDGAAINWAGDIFRKHADRRGIFAAHNIPPGGGEQNNLVTKHDNIFMAVAGHDCRSNGEDHWTSTSTSGYTQNYMLSDYQCRSNKGAFVRYYTFKPTEDVVCARTYNITEKSYEVDDDSEFCFFYEM